MKKLMSLVLALAMILSLLPAAAKPRERHLTARRFPAGNSRDFGRRFP